MIKPDSRAVVNQSEWGGAAPTASFIEPLARLLVGYKE